MARNRNNELKQKKQPQHWFSRIVLSLLAAIVPAAAYFGEYIYAVIESDIFKMLAQLTGKTGDTGATVSAWSLQRFVQEIVPKIQGGNGNSLQALWTTLEPIHTALWCTAVFFAIAVVLAPVILVWSLCTRKRMVPLVLSCTGLVSMIALFFSFRAAATPLLDGSLPLSAFFSNSLIASTLAGMNSFSTLRLSSGYFVMLFLYIAMILWLAANSLVDWGEKGGKKA